MHSMRFAMLCVLAACGRIGFDATTDDAGLPLIDEPPRYVAGTRLQPVVYRGTDGTLLAHWYDAELDITCHVAELPDGTWRCMPTHAANLEYKDAACTQPILRLAPPFAQSCGLTPRVGYVQTTQTAYETGAPYSGSAYSNAGSCAVSPTVDPVVYAEVGPEIPLTRFVQFEREIIAGAQRLAYVDLVGTDGARQRYFARLYDTKVDELCTLVDTENGSALCVPDDSVAPASFRYRDSACTDAILSVEPSVPRALVNMIRMCARDVRLYEVGAPVTGTVYTRQGDGSCVVPSGEVSTYFERGAELPLDDLATLTLTNEPYDARLRLNVWRTADGIGVIEYHPWTDTTRGTRCEMSVEETTSSLVCAPAWGFNERPYYTTPDCTGPVQTSQASCRPDSVAIFFPSLMVPWQVCEGSRMRIFAEETPVSTTIYERDVDGACVGSTVDLLTTTRELPYSDMAPLTRVRE